MAGNMLHATASLQCPHGGKVQIVPSHPCTTLGGVPIATANDTFTVLGCPFQIPATPPIPSPCVTVRWVVTDLLVQANSAPTLSQSSQGMCYSAQQAPQGPVVIQNTQPMVSSK
jgi:hypothetical protein